MSDLLPDLPTTTPAATAPLLEQTKAASDPLFEQKQVEYYSALVSAWIETKMERDRTLITISSIAIGLLVTVLTTVGVTPKWTVWLYAASFFGFGLTIALCLHIFSKNSVYIEKLLQSGPSSNAHLTRLDKASAFSFAIGALALIAIGLLSAIFQATPIRQATVSDDPTPTSQQPLDRLDKSFGGLDSLAPGKLGGMPAPGAPVPQVPVQPLPSDSTTKT